jgi:hypothetical protein
MMMAKNRLVLLVALGSSLVLTILVVYGHTQLAFFAKPTDDETVILGLILKSDASHVLSRKPAARRQVDSVLPEIPSGASDSLPKRASDEVKKLDNFNDAEPIFIGTDANPSEEAPNTFGNSERWLNSERYGNLNDDPMLSDELTKSMILKLEFMLVPEASATTTSETMGAILGQTICHEKGRFLNRTIPADQKVLTTTGKNEFDDKTIRNWAVKLIYLALHYHQHHHAAPEATMRYANNNNSNDNQCFKDVMKEKHNVGIFDYECPDAKYLVMPLCGNGLGANVRGGMVLALLMGLVSNRVVLFTSGAQQGSEYLRNPWPLASCPRRDYQCFFWAASPCTVTQDEIGNAHVLTRPQYRSLVKKGRIPQDIDHHKVWTFNSQFMPPTWMPPSALSLLHAYATKLIDAVPQDQYPVYVDLLTQAANSILADDEPRIGYDYAAANVKVSHALSFYSTRPNPSHAQKLNEIMDEIVPKDLDPEKSMGLPIRGTLTSMFVPGVSRNHCWCSLTFCFVVLLMTRFR